MRLHRTTHLLTSWITLSVILMVALAPWMSSALGAKYGTRMEVCTSIGAQWLLQYGGSEERPAPAGDAQVSDHCPHCALHANPLPIPASPVTWAFAQPLPKLLTAAILAAPRTLYAWLSAQSRAPPFGG